MTGLKRRIKEGILERVLPDDFYFRVNGRCPCCNQDVHFVAYHPWLRDHFCCSRCGSIPRNRALIEVLRRCRPGYSTLAIHESSPDSGAASARLRADCPGYVASQYHPGHRPGSMIDGFRVENLERQTFADASFDVVVTQDVMEHVYDPAAAFREIARTLKPGGVHVFSVPLVNRHAATQIWASRRADGNPQFLHEPEFHGNPVDPDGSPVTMHWGFDIVDFICQACGLDTEIVHLDDLSKGIRAEYIEILVTRKPPAATAAAA